jgi:DNA-binding response OmpR family regulator
MSKLRILVAEDRKNWQNAIKQILTQLGEEHQVDICPSFRDAERKLTASSYDLALIDLTLSTDAQEVDPNNEAGLDLLSIIRDTQHDCAAIILTGYPSHETTKKALRSYEAYDYLVKGEFDKNELLESIRGAILHARLGSAERQRQDRYQFSVTVNDHRVVSVGVHGPLQGHTYLVREDAIFDGAELSRRADNINVFGMPIGPEEWRPELNAIGTAVAEALKQDQRVYADLNTAMALASQRHQLCLEFIGPPETLGLPFELLLLGSNYLATSHVISRRIESPMSRKLESFSKFIRDLATAKAPLRILLISSNVDGCIPAVELEIDTLSSLLCRELDQLGLKYKIEIMKDPQHDILVEALQKNEYHILHYAGHGRFDDQLPEVSGFVLADGEDMRTLTANELELLLHGSALRLVYASCCLGARANSQTNRGVFQGVMHALAHADIPYIVGYRWKVDDESALAMAEAFYAELLQTLSPRDALLQARRKAALGIRGRDESIWAAAVLIAQNG